MYFPYSVYLSKLKLLRKLYVNGEIEAIQAHKTSKYGSGKLIVGSVIIIDGLHHFMLLLLGHLMTEPYMRIPQSKSERNFSLRSGNEVSKELLCLSCTSEIRAIFNLKSKLSQSNIVTWYIKCIKIDFLLFASWSLKMMLLFPEILLKIFSQNYSKLCEYFDKLQHKMLTVN